jgi:hypothetical protein
MQGTKNVENIECSSLIEWDLHLRQHHFLDVTVSV